MSWCFRDGLTTDTWFYRDSFAPWDSEETQPQLEGGFIAGVVSQGVVRTPKALGSPELSTSEGADSQAPSGLQSQNLWGSSWPGNLHAPKFPQAVVMLTDV